MITQKEERILHSVSPNTKHSILFIKEHGEKSREALERMYAKNYSDEAKMSDEEKAELAALSILIARTFPTKEKAYDEKLAKGIRALKDIYDGKQ